MSGWAAVVLDPGGTTGWCTVDAGARLLRAGQVTGHEWEQVDAVLRLWLAGRRGREMPALVVEAFRLRVDLNEGAKSRPETLSPVRLTATIEWAVYRLAVKGVVPASWGTTGAVDTTQGGGDAKGFATDERLKRWGLYVPGDHARDAVRHAVLWLAKNGQVPQEGWRAERVRGSLTD